MPTTRPAATQYSSASSSSSSVSDASFRLGMDARPVASVEVLRCLRCHRHVETTSTDDLGSTGMIRVGFNLYYCTKCAAAPSKCLGDGYQRASKIRSIEEMSRLLRTKSQKTYPFGKIQGSDIVPGLLQ
ncbi:hypothetical protein F4680DRAFT_451698 [Xylaria scruposa]|nr:hypothetical protein F4680DRAFT_451698 [Xylaria scruposa]